MQRPRMSHRILLFENDAATAKAILEALTRSSDEAYEVEWIKRCSEGLEKLNNIAAVLADLYLPDSRRLIDATTRKIAPSPVLFAIRSNKPVGLPPNCALIRRDGLAAAVVDQPGILQLCRGRGYALAPHTKHIRDQFLRHDEFIRRQEIQAHKQPAA